MGLHNLIANGGKVLIVGGTMNKGWASFKDHPQLVFWCGEQKDIRQHLRNGNNFPDNVRGLILSRFISHSESSKLIEEARKKRALIMAMKNDGEITQILSEIVAKPDTSVSDADAPSPTEEQSTPAEAPVKGGVTEFVAKHHQTELHNAAEGRRIFALAQKANIKTTEASVVHAVGIYRKRLNIVIPRPVKRTTGATAATTAPVREGAPSATNAPGRRGGSKSASKDDGALIKMLDDAIAGLTLVREEIVDFRRNQNEYLALKAKLAELIK